MSAPSLPVYLFIVLAPPAATYLLWGRLLSQGPRKLVLASVCYVAGVSLLIATAGGTATTLTLRVLEPACSTWAWGCDLKHWYSQALQKDPVFSIGSYATTRTNPRTGPAFIPILWMLALSSGLTLLWWVASSRAVGRTFAVEGATKGFKLFATMFLSYFVILLGFEAAFDRDFWRQRCLDAPPRHLLISGP